MAIISDQSEARPVSPTCDQFRHFLSVFGSDSFTLLADGTQEYAHMGPTQAETVWRCVRINPAKSVM